jgi:hypothetical protein
MIKILVEDSQDEIIISLEAKAMSPHPLCLFYTRSMYEWFSSRLHCYFYKVNNANIETTIHSSRITNAPTVVLSIILFKRCPQSS